MSSELRVIVPQGFFGGSPDDPQLDRFLRALAIKHPRGDGWGGEEKYGTDRDTDTWMMKPFCWCDERDCRWCYGDGPNFEYKPTEFRVWWYKYIGRGMRVEGAPDDAMWGLVSEADYQKLHELQSATAAGLKSLFAIRPEEPR